MRQATWMGGWYSKVILAVMCLCFVASRYSSAQTPRDIAEKSFPSVVSLVMQDVNGQPVSLGSGFFVRGNVVATNLHVIEGAAGGYAKIVGQKTKYDIAGIVGVDAKPDLVLLEIADVKAPPLVLGDTDKVAVGDEVYAIGNPLGLEGTFSRGILSGVRQIDSETLFQITTPISPGSSGGPVLNSLGEVIGVAVATFKGGQNLNFAIPASYLVLLLQDIKPVGSLSTRTSYKRERSILDDLGEPGIEGVTGESLTWRDKLYEFDGDYSFTIRNKLRESVQDVYCLVIFYDRDGRPLDFDLVHYEHVIPAGLGKRIKGSVDASVKRLTTPPSKDNPYMSSLTPTTEVEFRILDFKILE